MISRTSETIVTFRNSFSVGNTISDQPAGDYRVAREEELIEGLSYPAYHVISTAMQIPAIGVPSMTKQFIEVSSFDLNAAIERDQLVPRCYHMRPSDDPSSMAARARNFDSSPSADNDNR